MRLIAKFFVLCNSDVTVNMDRLYIKRSYLVDSSYIVRTPLLVNNKLVFV
jgi:hypothetical protein